MEFSKGIETLAATAETANEAAEAALLASEGVMALSIRVGDEVQQAIKKASRPQLPPIKERDQGDETKQKLSIPLLATLLTLAGVGYLVVENLGLAEQLGQQREVMMTLREQVEINSAESTTQIMLLAEQGQRAGELLQELEKKLDTPPVATVSEPPPPSPLLEEIRTTLLTLREDLATLPTADEESTTTAVAKDDDDTPSTPEMKTTVATAAPITESNLSTAALAQIRTLVQEELERLHQSVAAVEHQLDQQSTLLTTRQTVPAATTAPPAPQYQYQKGQEATPSPQEKKVLPYRFP